MAHPFTIGLDLGDRTSRLCILDPEGEVTEEGRIRSTPGALRLRFEALPPSRIVLEVGTHSAWASRLLTELGHDAIVANARKLRFIYGNESKNDKVDAEALARVGRLDPKLLAPIQHRGRQAQADLALVRSRDLLVRSRAARIANVRGTAKSTGHRLPRCSAPAFAGKAREYLPHEWRAALAPVLEAIHVLDQRLRAYDRSIEAVAESRYPDLRRLTQVHGVGTLTALCFVLTLEDPDRFESSRAVGPYTGLVPRRADSGESEPELRITRTGDARLRRLSARTTCWVPSASTPTSGARGSSSPPGAEKPPRSAPSSPSHENSPSCSTASG